MLTRRRFLNSTCLGALAASTGCRPAIADSLLFAKGGAATARAATKSRTLLKNRLLGYPIWCAPQNVIQLL